MKNTTLSRRLQFVMLAVACVMLASGQNSRATQNLVYQGLLNTSLGNASMAVECCISNLSSSGQDGLALYITNLSSSGQDGVSIALPPNLSGLDVHCLDVDPSNALPAGVYIQSEVIGPVGAGTSGALATVKMTKTGSSNYVVSADFSPLGTTSYTVQAYRNGILVGQATTNTPSDIIIITKTDDDGTSWDVELDDENCYKASTIDCVEATAMVLPGGLNVSADHVWITPLNIPLIKPTAFQLTASQVPAITITGENESLAYAGLTNTSLGYASVAIECCVSNLSSGGQDGLTLYITNLSSSGQDGVSIALPPGLSALVMEWQPLDASNSLPVGADVQEQLVGTANGITNGVLGTVTVTKAGTTNYAISADFSPSGASTYTVQAYLNRVLVAQATGQNGQTVAQATSCISDWDFEISCCPLEWHFTHGWGGSPTSLTLTGGTSIITCDNMDITPENVSWPGPPTALQITGSQVPSMSITAVAVSPLLLSPSLNSQTAKLQWYGTGALQESSNLTTWTSITNAYSPYDAAAPPPNGPSKFYRLVFRP